MTILRASSFRLFAAAALSVGLLLACTLGGKVPPRGEAASRSSLTWKEAETRARQITGVSYVLWFGLGDRDETFEGRTVINFQLKEGAAKAASRTFIDFAEGEITSLRVNQASFSPEQILQKYDGSRIWLDISELSAGSNRIEIAYRHPYSNTGNGLHRFQDPIDQQVYLYSNFEPYNARKMFPCFDQPDLKATYELTVEAPENWTVISSTLERKVSALNGRKSWEFPVSRVFSTYLFPLHAGPYASWSADAKGIPMRLFARKSLAKHVDHKEWFEITRNGLDFFQVQFGYAYPFAKYDQLIVPDFNAGAMENVAAVTFNEHYVFRSKVTEDRRRRRADTILHEMAHMWFGNLVTMQWWNGLWLNESFATFASTWALNEATRFAKTSDPWQAFFSGMKQWAYWEDRLVTTHPIEVAVPDTEMAFAIFDGITYGKGASVLKQLSFYIGMEDFREGLQRYFQRHAFRNTTLADFIKALSEASGQVLQDWQKRWLQTAGVNTLRAEFQCAPNDQGKNVISSFDLKQLPSEYNHELRPHRTRVALYSSSLTPGKVLDVEYAGPSTAVAKAVGLPCPDLVFPNYQDHDYVRIDLDPVSLRTVKEKLGKISDPFVRQVLWHTLWEMTVDARLPATELAEIIMKHLGSEKDTKVLEKVLANLINTDPGSGSAVKYMPEEVRNRFMPRIEAFVRGRLNAAPAGSDAQLVWYGAFLRSAHSGEAKNFLQGLLLGKASLRGLKIEQDRRWEILQTLARIGVPGTRELIQDELKRDPSDFGIKAAIYADAALPDLSIKREWLQAILKKAPKGTPSPGLAASPAPASAPVPLASRELKNAQLEMAIAGLHQLGQEELISQLADDYFNSLGELATREDEEYVAEFARGAFPSICEKVIVDRATAWVVRHDGLPAAVIKALRINTQEERHCLQAQQVIAKLGH